MPESIRSILARGRKALEGKRAADEAAKLGWLRGGNAGAVVDGVWYGKCGRLAHLRSLGIEESKDDTTQLMMSSGLAHETIVEAELEAAGVKILRGEAAREAVPVGGTTLGVSPDVLVLDDAGKITHGIELKLCSSLWTAKGVHYDLQPKSDHLIQAGLYSYLMGNKLGLSSGLPWTLLYTSRVDWHLSTAPAWLQAKFPVGCYDVEFRDDGKPLKIRPFEREYQLSWTADGRLQYMTEGLKAPVVTKLTVAAMLEYYERTAAVAATKQLPPRPTDKGIDGSKSYKACDYCELASVCDSVTDYDSWIDHSTATFRGPEGESA